MIATTKEVNEYGDPINSDKIERPVFAELKNIGMKEFYQAQATSLKPELKFKIADYMDYNQEKLLRYADERGNEAEYKIIRTYRTGNELEITCERGVEE